LKEGRPLTQPPDFEAFVAGRGASLQRYGYVLTGNQHDAADLVQEALIKLRGAWHRVANKDNPEGYVRTIMARHHISALRRIKREFLTGNLPERPSMDPERPDDELWQALGRLPTRQRAVLVLRYYEQLSDEEITALLGISRGTVRSQAARGLTRLREICLSLEASNL